MYANIYKKSIFLIQIFLFLLFLVNAIEERFSRIANLQISSV